MSGHACGALHAGQRARCSACQAPGPGSRRLGPPACPRPLRKEEAVLGARAVLTTVGHGLWKAWMTEFRRPCVWKPERAPFLPKRLGAFPRPDGPLRHPSPPEGRPSGSRATEYGRIRVFWPPGCAVTSGQASCWVTHMSRSRTREDTGGKRPLTQDGNSDNKGLLSKGATWGGHSRQEASWRKSHTGNSETTRAWQECGPGPAGKADTMTRGSHPEEI